jgi:hypothetical protein
MLICSGVKFWICVYKAIYHVAIVQFQCGNLRSGPKAMVYYQFVGSCFVLQITTQLFDRFVWSPLLFQWEIHSLFQPYFSEIHMS